MWRVVFLVDITCIGSVPGLVLIEVSRTCDLSSKCQVDARSIFNRVKPQVEGGGMYNLCTG